jgi:acetyl-CoA carboxylase/biotin carboxylase 1
MLQCSDFVDNKINTGWLDQRIAANVRAEKPPWELCVIGAAAVRAHEAFACKAAEYLGFLSKGQLPPADISLIFFQVSCLQKVADGPLPAHPNRLLGTWRGSLVSTPS